MKKLLAVFLLIPLLMFFPGKAYPLGGEVPESGRVLGQLVYSLEVVTTTSADPGLGTADPLIVVTNIVTDATGAAADEVSLANGTSNGQTKIFTLKTDNETTGVKVIPATYAGGTSVQFDDAGDGCTFNWDGTSWVLISNNGGTIA